MHNLKVCLMQVNQIWEDKKANLSHFDFLLKNIQKPVDLIVFPEMFQTGFSMNPEKLAETMKGPSLDWLKEKAKSFNCALITSLIIKEDEKYFNRMVFVRENGTVQYYDKRKLFSYAKEDKSFSRGNHNVLVEYKGWKIILQVCYDLRFPELGRNKVEDAVYAYDLMINVANWPQKRALHWKTLLQARAIENQTYVLGVNRVGEGKSGLLYSGDSSIISPDGTIEEQIADKECVITSVINYDNLLNIRARLPFLKDQ